MRILYDCTYVALWEPSVVWEYSYLHTGLVLAEIWAELCSSEAHYRSLEFSHSLSTHLRSNESKKFADYKQRALPSTSIPVPLTTAYIREPLFTFIWVRWYRGQLFLRSATPFSNTPLDSSQKLNLLIHRAICSSTCQDPAQPVS